MGKKVKEFLFKRSGQLFARPSFMEGFGRVLDLGTTLNIYNQDSEQEVDAIALSSDWLAVGDVLSESIAVIEKEAPPSLQKELQFS